MKHDIKHHIKTCETCKRIKVDTSRPAGLLQPLPIPDKPWFDITMDFVTGLPKSHGFEVIFVVVDRLTKFVHFMLLSHPFTVAKVALEFMKGVLKLHGLPRTIVSDRDAAFTSAFWRELFKLQGIELAMSYAYHHSSTRMTPFEALYGYPSPRVLDYVLGTTQVVAVDTFLHDRTTLLTLLK